MKIPSRSSFPAIVAAEKRAAALRARLSSAQERAAGIQARIAELTRGKTPDELADELLAGGTPDFTAPEADVERDQLAVAHREVAALEVAVGKADAAIDAEVQRAADQLDAQVREHLPSITKAEAEALLKFREARRQRGVLWNQIKAAGWEPNHGILEPRVLGFVSNEQLDLVLADLQEQGHLPKGSVVAKVARAVASLLPFGLLWIFG